MRVYILAGGKGTRLAGAIADLPKPLVKVAGRPILEYQIELCKKYGLNHITILIHHLGRQIMDYCGDGGKWGVSITYFQEPEPLGTAGGLKELAAGFKEDALVFYGDILMNLNLQRFMDFHRDKKAVATLAVQSNNHPFDSDLVEVDDQNHITRFINKPHAPGLVYRNLVNAACYAISPKICRFIEKGRSQDFAKDIFPKVLAQGEKLQAYKTSEYLKDIGTPERLAEAGRAVDQGVFDLYNFDHPKPAVFLDRDGVITEEDFQKNLDRLVLLPGAIEAIKKINQSKYLAIIISNQAAVAKGFCSYEDVLEFNKKLETRLGDQGAKLDGIYFCPHIPDKGFPGENLKYKIECDCRKPKTGMIDQAVKDFNIDLSQSYFIGDASVDAQTAKNAGIKFIGVKTGHGCKDGKYRVEIKKIYQDLNQAVDGILNER